MLGGARDEHAVTLVGDALASTHNPDKLLPVILHATMEATGAARGRVLQDGRVTVEEGGAADGRPLRLVLDDDESVGEIALEIWPASGSFDARTRTLAKSLAAQAAIALENARLHSIVQRQATTDELTELANRRHFTETLDTELRRAERFGEPLALVFADLDDFKRVNDRHGHQVGDDVLRAFADCLRKRVRVIDVAARLGGEEFAVLLVETDLAGAEALAESLREAVATLEVPVRGGDPVSAHRELRRRRLSGGANARGSARRPPTPASIARSVRARTASGAIPLSPENPKRGMDVVPENGKNGANAEVPFLARPGDRGRRRLGAVVRDLETRSRAEPDAVAQAPQIVQPSAERKVPAIITLTPSGAGSHRGSSPARGGGLVGGSPLIPLGPGASGGAALLVSSSGGGTGTSSVADQSSQGSSPQPARGTTNGSSSHDSAVRGTPGGSKPAPTRRPLSRRRRRRRSDADCSDADVVGRSGGTRGRTPSPAAAPTKKQAKEAAKQAKKQAKAAAEAREEAGEGSRRTGEEGGEARGGTRRSAHSPR